MKLILSFFCKFRARFRPTPVAPDPELCALITEAEKAREALAEAKAQIEISIRDAETEWPPFAYVPAGRILIEETLPDLAECDVGLRADIERARVSGKPFETPPDVAESILGSTSQLLAIAGRQRAAERLPGAR